MATVDRRGASLSAADPPISTNPNPDLAWKAPVRVATTGSNITLSGLQTIDGVALAVGDRVLVKDQADATSNGLYNAQTGPWTRTVDASNNSQWTSGLQVLVNSGTLNGHTPWQVATLNPITLGTSAIAFVPLSLLGATYTAPFTGGVARTAIGKFSDVISVLDFGAVGDGVTDDTAAITAAMSAAASSGRALYLPARTYLTDVLTVPAALSRITGESRAATLKFKRRTYATAAPLVTITGNTANLQIDTLSIDVNSTLFNNTQTIVAAGSNNLTIKNLVLTGEAQIGIRATSGDNVIVRDITCLGTNDGFAACVQGDNSGGALTRMRVEDCRFTGVFTFGAAILSGDGCAIANSRANGNTGSGFAFLLSLCTSSIIAGCHSIDSAFEAFQLTDCNYCAVIGNTCEWTSAGGDFGISVNGTANMARFNLVANNTILNSYKAGIALADWAQYTVVANNLLRNCGVRGTGGGGSGGAITQLAAATVSPGASCTGNQFRGNICVSESGTTTYGYSETNAGGGGSTVDSNTVAGNFFSGVTTISLLAGANSLFFDDIWRVYIATVSAGSGAITSYTVNASSFRQFGKTIEIQLDITITTAGTGSGALIVTLPIAAAVNGGALAGREIAVAGKTVAGSCSGASIQLFQADNTSAIQNGARVVVSGVYRTQ